MRNYRGNINLKRRVWLRCGFIITAWWLSAGASATLLAADQLKHGAGAGKAVLVTRPIPMNQGTKEYRPSPFFITFSETTYNQPALAALTGASKDSPDYVARGLVSAIVEDDKALFKDLTVPEEQDQAGTILDFLRGAGGGTEGTLVSRVDLGGASLYLIKTKGAPVPMISLILKETTSGYRQSFQMTQQPVCSVVIVLWGAIHSFPKAFAAVDKKFEHSFRVGPVEPGAKGENATISFDRGCETSFVTYDVRVSGNLVPAGDDCGAGVREVLQFDQDFWTLVAEKKYDEVLAAIDAGAAQRLIQLRKVRGDSAVSPALVFNRREVKYVFGSKDCYVLLSWVRLNTPGSEATALRIEPDVVVRSSESKWQMYQYNAGNAFTALLAYRPLTTQLMKLASQ